MTWQEYFLTRLEQFDFKPWPFYGDDKNLLAFGSKEEFASWYCQPPGQVGEPYRDESFYPREFTNLSRLVCPKKIVEFGTSLGIGTLILRILNPDAELITVDNRTMQYIPGNIEVVTGLLAIHEGIKASFVHGKSWEFATANVELCFIDADHSYEGVAADNERAWKNRNPERGAIFWHDHNNRHLGVMRAVKEFVERHQLTLKATSDSAIVWTEWGIPCAA